MCYIPSLVSRRVEEAAGGDGFLLVARRKHIFYGYITQNASFSLKKIIN